LSYRGFTCHSCLYRSTGGEQFSRSAAWPAIGRSTRIAMPAERSRPRQHRGQRRRTAACGNSAEICDARGRCGGLL